MAALSVLITVFAVILLIPSLVFFLECFAALFFVSKEQGTRPAGVSAVILIPAHDEAPSIAATVTSLREQLAPTDRILVVADNCQDDTANVARDAGADVVERIDPDRRGKGYALAFGVERLAAVPPDVVLVVDADCRLEPGSMAALVREATRLEKPVQADYVSQPVGTSALSMISALAMLIRNRVRPRGLRRLGLPCHLMGSGMGFPWNVLLAAPDTEGDLVEDLLMGIELTLLGHEPALCVDAGVRSELPTDNRAALQQRRRWEHGQIGTLLRHGPRLIWAGITRLRPKLIVAGADLMVPPLALLVGLLIATAVAAGTLQALGGAMLPLAITGASLGLVGFGVVLGWARYGREMVPFRYLLMVPFYLLWKLPLYLSFVFGRREREWRRTER